MKTKTAIFLLIMFALMLSTATAIVGFYLGHRMGYISGSTHIVERWEAHQKAHQKAHPIYSYRDTYYDTYDYGTYISSPYPVYLMLPQELENPESRYRAVPYGFVKPYHVRMENVYYGIPILFMLPQEKNQLGSHYDYYWTPFGTVKPWHVRLTE